MASVSLQLHEPVWAERFDYECESVEATVSSDCAVFHIGSTAIPDIPAKDTLDAVAVFRGVDAMTAARDALLADGFGRHRDDPEWVVLTRSRPEYDICLHLRPREHPRWGDQLAFREYLRDDPRARARYERAKRAAVAEYPDDVDAYTDAKAETILALTDEADERGYGTQIDAKLPGDE